MGSAAAAAALLYLDQSLSSNLEKTAEARVLITPSAASRRAENSIRFSFYDTSTNGTWIRITCSYTLQGFVGFSQSHYKVKLREWGASKKEALEPIRLPFTFTQPISLNSLRVEATGPFSPTALQTVATDEGGEVLVPIKESEIPPRGLFGNIFLIHGASNVRKECQLSISKLREFEFSAERVLMVWDVSSRSYKATAVFALNKNPRKQAFVEDSKPLSLSVSMTSDFAGQVSAERMDAVGRIHRIYFTAQESESIVDKQSAQILFSCEGKKYVKECTFSFLR